MTANKSVTARVLPAEDGTPAAAAAQWTSVLDAPGATGNVTVNGASTAGVGRASAMLPVPEGTGEIRVNGVLATGSGPGTWRFERHAGTGAAVRVKVLEGQVSLVTPEAIVFRLRGQPGERVAFAIVPCPDRAAARAGARVDSRAQEVPMPEFVRALAVSELLPGNASRSASRASRSRSTTSRAPSTRRATPASIVAARSGQGALDGQAVLCPWHAWSWDVTTGENTANPELKIPTYPVKVEDGQVLVQVG